MDLYNRDFLCTQDWLFDKLMAVLDLAAKWYGEGPGRPNYEALRGKKLLLTWGSGALARSWCSVQAALLISSRFGMHVTMAYQDGVFQKQAEIEKARAYQGWTTTGERMACTENAIFTHPMPVDRGSEVTDEIASGPRSAIYDVAENRLHVQKALMALTIGNL